MPDFARLFLGLVLVVSVQTSLRAAEAPPKVYRASIEPNWLPDNQLFWYRLSLPGDRREFILVNAEKPERRPAFDHDRVAEVLTKLIGKEIDPKKLPFDRMELTADGKTLKLFGETSWRFDLASYDATEEKTAKSEETPPSRRERSVSRREVQPGSKSPDGKTEIAVRGHNLVLLQGTNEFALTHDGNPGHSYARSAQRARQVEMRYEEKDSDSAEPQIFWAPNSKYFVAMRTRPGTDRIVYMVQSSPVSQLQPKLHSYPYAKPGDEIPVTKPHLFSVEERREIPLKDDWYSNPWSISEVRWLDDSTEFSFLYNQRGHQILRLLSVAAETGAIRKVMEETSATFIDYSGKFFYGVVNGTREIVWMSERDGWNHLYLIDAAAGAVRNQITRGEWVVRDVVQVDDERRQIWFRAGGIYPDQDPYHIHYARVNFDGTGLKALTRGDGTHLAQFSPDRRYFVDTWSRVDRPPVIELRAGDDGSLILNLEEADLSELGPDWKAPERFSAKARDGSTDIFGIIHRPKAMRVGEKYPVIESIYAGPHSSFVPKAFAASYNADKLTRQGFIVVQIDGLGTSNRSKKFHDVCWRNLADAGLPDRILWIKAAAAKYPEFDLDRVGIYGTSAGGQSALAALLWHGDFYKAAVADCGCHDNRMDKIWWNEQWMGWPVGPHYAEQSNVTQAHRLQGKLLLMVGELDRNVDPASTLQVANALVKADKDFEFLLSPGVGHGVARTDYGWRRLEEFFVRHLQPGSAGR